ncbi:MAG: glutaredoxin 3 [Alphaproteobacteria bacterium]
MPAITMYTTKVCPYCIAAKRLLNKKGAAFEEVDVSFDAAKREELIKLAGGRMTVPQIFIGDYHVGGCDELYELEASGKLDTLLNG